MNIIEQDLFKVKLLRVKVPLELDALDEIRAYFDDTSVNLNEGLTESLGKYQSSNAIGVPTFAGLAPLHDFLQKNMYSFWKEMGFADSFLAVERNWVNRYTKSDTDVPTHLFSHVHGATDLICTYYYKFPPGSATIRFHSPFEVPLGLTPQKTSSIAITPEEGEMLIWPGYVWHSVDNHYLDEERIIAGFHVNQQSFSVNQRFKRIAGNPNS